MKIEQPGFYQQYDGQKAEIVAVEDGWAFGFDGDNVPSIWSAETGKDQGGSDTDIFGVWTEPRTVKGWVNVYASDDQHTRQGILPFFSTQQMALNARENDWRNREQYIGTFPVEFIEQPGGFK